MLAGLSRVEVRRGARVIKQGPAVDHLRQMEVQKRHLADSSDSQKNVKIGQTQHKYLIINILMDVCPV